MRISLLIPCYNAARFLPRLFETVRAQTEQFAEIVCYDDGSTDGTAQVVRSLGAKLIGGRQNRGSAHARNCLWRVAESEWVHFHDADDLMAPDFVAKMGSRAAGNTDIVICTAEWRNADTREVEILWRYCEAELLAAPISYLLNHPVGGINGVYRRSVLDRIGGFNERLQVWEDADLHVRLAVSGARFAVVEEALVTALRRTDSVSAPMLRNWQHRLRALQDYTMMLAPADTPALVVEIERAAHALLKYGDPDGARLALRTAQGMGARVPTTKSSLISLCRGLFGPMAALRLQAIARRP